MATFDRKSVTVTAKSKHNRITITKSAKQDFEDIVTLHALIEDSAEVDFVGTEFELVGVRDDDIQAAKELFLKFSGERVIESTKYGEVIERIQGVGNIYINGVKVAEEENFLCSYNITVLTAPIKKALNRERTNVGRSAYTDSVKKILLSSTRKEVAEILAADLPKINLGTAHDELTWIDVQEHAIKILNQQGKYLFITAYEAMQHPDMLDQARNSGHEIITIPENLKYKIQDTKDFAGNPIIDFRQFIENYNESFEFIFIAPEMLSDKEKSVYEHTARILDLFGGILYKVKSINISSTMRNDFFGDVETLGCWDGQSISIVISRKVSTSISQYSGTLIHELIHAKTGQPDVSREFEISLTDQIGDLCSNVLLSTHVIDKVTHPVNSHPWYKFW